MKKENAQTKTHVYGNYGTPYLETIVSEFVKF